MSGYLEKYKNRKVYVPLPKITDSQIAEARAFPICEIVASYGFAIERKTSKGYFIKNPFDSEKRASFFVNTSASMNFAKAFNSEKKYNPISFLMEHENIAFPKAVRQILNLSVCNIYTKEINERSTDKEPIPTATKASDLIPLVHKGRLISLKYYFLSKERFICPKLAKEYGLQCLSSGKSYYLGIANDKGGIECFNNSKDKKYRKRCFGYKGITTFLAKNKTDNFIVFEAYLDFLSYLILNNVKQLKVNVIILNGTGQATEAIAKIKTYKPTSLFLCLDNDKKGIESKNYIKNSFECEIIDLSKMYSKFKDANELLQFRKGKPFAKLEIVQN